MLSYLADYATNAINPIFIVLILEEPLLSVGAPRQRLLRTLRFWARAVVSVAIAVILAELGKAHQIWHGHPSFPSGHTTFATSAAVCLTLQRGPAWSWLCAPLALLMAAGLVYGRWHTVDEVIAGLALGTIVPCLLWRLTDGRRRASALLLSGESVHPE